MICHWRMLKMICNWKMLKMKWIHERVRDRLLFLSWPPLFFAALWNCSLVLLIGPNKEKRHIKRLNLQSLFKLARSTQFRWKLLVHHNKMIIRVCAIGVCIKMWNSQKNYLNRAKQWRATQWTSQFRATYWIFRPFHIKTNGEGSYSKRDKKEHMKKQTNYLKTKRDWRKWEVAEIAETKF